MEDRDNQYCRLKHERIDEKLSVHSNRLNNHSARLDSLDQFKSSTLVEIRNLTEKIGELISLLTKIFITFMTIGVGFFIWYIQML